jgi:alpha-beta hydrolase superfamily lysophospholipase
MRHFEGSFDGVKGLKIYYQAWLPEGAPKATLVVAHGYAEHSGRYKNLVNCLVPSGYAVYALDHRGHGRSEGPRTQVDDFDDYVLDLKTFVEIVRERSAAPKLILVGHSMGASISVAYVLRFPNDLDALVLSGCVIAPTDPELLAQVHARTPPRVGDLSQALSRDPAVGEAYRNDPLVTYVPPSEQPRREGAPSTSAAAAMRRPALFDRAGEVRLPVLMLAGTASPLGDGPRSEAFHAALGSSDKTLKLYEGLLHEVFNEPEHPQVFADVEAWLREHL